MLAVPGEITSSLSAGTNALLRLGATPVTCAARTCSSSSGSSRRQRRAACARADRRGDPRAARRRARSRRTSSSARPASSPARARPRSSSSSSPVASRSRTVSIEQPSRIAWRRCRPSSYWLDEPTDPLPRVVGSTATADVAVVGGGITGCSCALALAEAGLRVRLFEAREIAGGASGRNGGFALRGGAAPYPGARRVDRRRGDGRALALDGGGARRARARSRATRFARPGACGSPPTTRSATSCARSTRRCARRASRRSGARTCRRRSPGATRRRSSIRPTASCSRRGSSAGSPRGRPRPASRSDEHTRVGVGRGRRGAETVVVATDGYPSGLLGELEGLIVPTRGQVIATEPIEEMLFEIPHYGRHGFDYWHQRPDGRIVAGGFRDVSLDTEFTADEVTTPVVQDALERFVEEHVGRPLRVDYRWAGIFGMVFDFLPGRRARARRRRALDRGRLLGPRQRARLRVRAARRARDPRRPRPAARPLRARRGCSCTERGRPHPDGSSCLQVELAGLRVRGLRDREILDREAGRVEERDVAGAPAAVGLADEHRAELGDVVARRRRPPRRAPASSPPWLACSQSSQKRCARRSSSIATSAFPGPSAPMSETCWPGSSEPSG